MRSFALLPIILLLIAPVTPTIQIPKTSSTPPLSGVYHDGVITLEDKLSITIIHTRNGLWIYTPNAPLLPNPPLPFKRLWVAIPPNTEAVSVEVEPLAEQHIAPAEPPPPPSILALNDASAIFTLPPAHVHRGAMLEYQGWLRYYKVVSVVVFPAAYNPARRALSVWTRFRIHIHYRVVTSPLPAVEETTLFDTFAQLLLANPKEAWLWRGWVQRARYSHLAPDHVDYVIVCPEALSEAFVNLTRVVETLGLRTQIVTLEWVNATYEGRDLMEKVHDFLADAVDQWGIVYAVLGFDASVFGQLDGLRYICVYDYAYEPVIAYDLQYKPCDDYFAGLDHNWDLDGDGNYGESSYYCAWGVPETDLLYDIIVARLPVHTAEEVQAYVERLAARNATDSHLLLAGAFITSAIEGAWVCYHQEHELHAFTAFFNHMQIHRLFETKIFSETNLTNYNVRSHLTNYNISVFSWVSHGHVDGAYLYYTNTPFISVADINTVSRPVNAFAWAMSCLTAALDSEETDSGYGPSLGEAWIRNPNGGTAYFGYPRTSYAFIGGNHNETLSWGVVVGLSAGLQCLTWKVLNRTHITAPGPLIYLAKLKYFEGSWGYSTWNILPCFGSRYAEIERKSVLTGMLFGEPSVPLIANSFSYRPPRIEVLPTTVSSDRGVQRFWIRITPGSAPTHSVVLHLKQRTTSFSGAVFDRWIRYPASPFNTTHWYADVAIPFGSFEIFAEVVDAAGLSTYSNVLHLLRPLPAPYYTQFDIEKRVVFNDTVSPSDSLWLSYTTEGPVAHRGEYFWWTGPYVGGANWNLTSPSINASGLSNVTLSFWWKGYLEYNGDWGYAYFSIDGGGTWFPLLRYTGTFDWKRVTFTVGLGSQHWWYSGLYPRNVVYSLTTPAIDVTGYDTVYLSFDHRYDLGPYDEVSVLYNLSTSSNTLLESFEGSDLNWSHHTYAIDVAGATQLYIIFRLESPYHAWERGLGWWIDNVNVTASDGTLLFYDDIEGPDPGWSVDGRWRREGATGDQVAIRLQLLANAYANYPGLLVDDVNITAPDGTTIFYDGAETERFNWTMEGEWHRSATQRWHVIETPDAPSSPFAWYSGSWDCYDTILELAASINASGFDEIVLLFDHRYATEHDTLEWDYCHIEVSPDNGTHWLLVASYTGASDWHREVVSLTPVLQRWKPTHLLIRFHYHTDERVHETGWLLDNIALLFLRYPSSWLEGWVPETSGWHLTDRRAYSANGSLWCGDEASRTYPPNTQRTIQLWLNLSQTPSEGTIPVLSARIYADLASGDYVVIESSTNGTAWQLLTVVAEPHSWDPIQVVLPEGSVIAVRFRLVSDSEEETSGVFLDDLSVEWVVDREPPLLRIIQPVNGTLLNNQTVYVSWEASDNIALDHFEILLNSTLVTTTTQPYVVLSNLSDGWYNLTVVAVDTVGWRTPATTFFAIDTTPPSVTLLRPSPHSIVPAACRIEWQTYDAFGIAELRLRYFNVTHSSPWYVVGGLHSVEVLLPSGEVTIELLATDLAGNTACTRVSVLVDSQPPVIQVHTPRNMSIVNASLVTISWSASDNTGIDYFMVTTDEGVSIVLNASCTSCTLTLGDGYRIVCLQAVDIAGNTASTTLLLTVDTLPPLVVITQPMNGTTVYTRSLQLAWVATDPLTSILKISVCVDGVLYATLPANVSTITIMLSEGLHTITVTATDAAGNTASCTIRIYCSPPAIPEPTVLLLTALAVLVALVIISFLSRHPQSF